MPTVRINDMDMYYEIHGVGEPVVLIAGLNSDHALSRLANVDLIPCKLLGGSNTLETRIVVSERQIEKGERRAR